MFETIMVPVDGSPQDEMAISTAARIARDANATLRLVRVHVPYHRDLEVLPGLDEDLMQLEESYLSRLADGTRKEYERPIQTQLLDGPVGPALSERAASLPSPLVVMSTHGRTGFSRMWLGSVADDVVRHASVPVLLLRITPLPAGASEPGPLYFRRVVVPLDGSERAEQVLEPAMALAALDHGCIHLVRVLEQIILPEYPFALVPPVIETIEDLEARKHAALEYLERVAARARSRVGVKDVSTEVITSHSVATAILDAVKSRAADLVAVATHGRGASRLVMGSVADKLVRGSGCAVLVVRPPREAGEAAKG